MLETISAVVIMVSLGIMVLSIMVSEATILSAEIMMAGVVVFILGMLGLAIDVVTREITGR